MDRNIQIGMCLRVLCLASVLWGLLLGSSSPSRAGVGDTPLPTFNGDSVPAQLVGILPTVVHTNNFISVVLCTNLSPTPVNIGVEVFDKNGVLVNTIGNGVGEGNGAKLGVAVGETVTIGTGPNKFLHDDTAINLGGTILANGSGRVVATSRQVGCVVLAVDSKHTIQDPSANLEPPPVMANLAVWICGDGKVDPLEDCDDGNTTDGDGCSATCQTEAPSRCPSSPDAGCESGFGKRFLLVKEKKPGKEKLIVRWKGGPALSQTDFGNPLNNPGTAYDVCIYDGNDALVGEMTVDRPGALCGIRNCWRNLGFLPPDGKGYMYNDKELSADGIQKILLIGGSAGKTQLQVKGKNNATKGQTALPSGIAGALAGSTSATVQLFGSDAPKCYSIELLTVLKNDPVQFKAK